MVRNTTDKYQCSASAKRSRSMPSAIERETTCSSSICKRLIQKLKTESRDEDKISRNALPEAEIGHRRTKMFKLCAIQSYLV